MTNITRSNFTPLRTLRKELCALSGEQTLILSVINESNRNDVITFPFLALGIYHSILFLTYGIVWMMYVAIIALSVYILSTCFFDAHQIYRSGQTRYALRTRTFWGLIISMLLSMEGLVALVMPFFMNRSGLFIIGILSCLTGLQEIALHIFYHCQYIRLDKRRRKLSKRYDENMAWFELFD